MEIQGKHSIKILTTADWHIGSMKGPERDGINLRLEDTIRCLEEMVRVAGEERPDLVLVAGDIFHQAEIWQGRSHRELHIARSIIKKLSEVSGEVIVMRGTPNHDAAEIFMSLTETFERFPNVKVITQPQVVQTEFADIVVVPGFDHGQFRAKFPGLSKEDENAVFSEELGNIITGMRALCRPDKMAILMSHYTVPGCNMESGQVQMFTKAEPVITQEMLCTAHYDLVALGHIHRPQFIPGLDNVCYSGAINAFNFNDEGQERGFWIHYAEEGAFGKEGIVFTDSGFHKTPYREFLTIRWGQEEVGRAITNPEILPMIFSQAGAADKIVRIIYSCTAEQKKAVNTAQIERALYEAGAFYKADIKLDAVEDVNKTELSKFDDPETNLIQYLREKGVTEPEEIGVILGKARPIIDRAKADEAVSEFTGTFIPKEISVKNYRNYAEAFFSFEDISFCTINGQNGAGKSSLFMDAIIDCLFEEPREGDLTGWIRNDEKARSGSISFTFSLGDSVFRVVRTRAKSGKATLNLAEYVNGEWMDRSKEKARDTQKEIVKVLGMDSLTFKACVLIMQDQYGLFLEVGKEERMGVLSNLLGLGIYSVMEDQTKCILADLKRSVSEKKNTVNVHQGTIAGYGDPGAEKEQIEKRIADLQENVRILTENSTAKKLIIRTQREAEERHKKIQDRVLSLESKHVECRQNITVLSSTIDTCERALESETETVEKVLLHDELVRQDKDVVEKAAVYCTKADELNRLRAQISDEESAVERLNAELQQKENTREELQDSKEDELIRSRASEYEKQVQKRDEWSEKERVFRKIEKELNDTRFGHSNICRTYEMQVKEYRLAEEEHRKKAALLENVDCIDIDNAKCAFLADALESKKKLTAYPGMFETMETAHRIKIRPYEGKIEKLEEQLSNLGYDETDIRKAREEIESQIAQLRPYILLLEELNQRENRIALIQAEIDNIKSNILDTQKRLSTVKAGAQEIEKVLPEYIEAAQKHREISDEIRQLKLFVDKAATYPVIRERRKNAEQQKADAVLRLTEIEKELNNAKEELEKNAGATLDIVTLQSEIDLIDAQIGQNTKIIGDNQQLIGNLNHKLDEIERLEKEISILQKEIIRLAKERSYYDLLRAAFSQDGIPHQIIRSLVPKLTEISSSILGQMTGGKMGIEFRTEKTIKSNSNKEVVVMDIFIEEYGKSVLPYLSKSGGEKVKASLSVILALAEIKASSAGIQLGMLFIDEPPFLDSDGVEAYCDALETIQNRYPDLKIMAITHDPTMKARFPQNLDVVKTDEGSRVIY